MNFRKYQLTAKTTAIYPRRYKLIYPTIGLAGEVGEFANKVKKKLRDNRKLDKEDLKSELGDILWYTSAVATDLGLNLEDVASKNIKKLRERYRRNKIKGSGDNR
jgi:NTP pyrophosphatase (non-canonical NTP hydrolase)